MFTNIHAARSACLVAALTLASLPDVATAQGGSKSSSAARQLTDALDRLKLDAIAAADPSDPESFAAALYFQGGQLLVVSAKYAAPPLLAAKLAKKEYRDIYIDLNAASVAGSKIFVMDQGCDGLVARPGDGVADSWEHGAKTVAFDGEWRKAKLTEEEYMKTFAEADERYARILTMLAEQASRSGS